jgi:aldehyde:ferredoxin oxidoreductase
VEDIGPRKVGFVKLTQLASALDDSLVNCSFLPYTWDIKVKALNAVTGWNTIVPELMRVAERIVTLSRLFNIKHGLTAADDKLPARFYQPKTDGALSDKPLDKEHYEAGRKFYYALMGWDDQGVPLPARVEELEIE